MSKSPPDLSELADLDRLVHEPARLAVMALLYESKAPISLS